MKCEVFSYRFGQEILQHKNFSRAWKEIEGILLDAPLFIWPNKSENNSKLDVVQQLMNGYFDRMFVIEHGWQHHPLATKIEGSKLTADYRKRFKGSSRGHLEVQTEVQFGNMARFYTDIFKFQAAYSARDIQIGMSVLPMQSLAVRIDSNVAHFERANRELPSAELSITLPILLVGLSVDRKTRVVDISKCGFKGIKDLTGKNKGENLRRVVHAYVSGKPMDSSLNDQSDPGPPLAISAAPED